MAASSSSAGRLMIDDDDYGRGRSRRRFTKRQRMPSRSVPRMMVLRAPTEPGYVDTALGNYVFDQTGSIVLLNTVPQGAGVSQRIGKRIALKSLQCRGNWANGTTAVLNDCALLIVYDKRPTGALPAITDILVTANARSFNNDTNSGRFMILKRTDASLLGTPSATGPDRSIKSGDFFLNLRGLPEVFKAAGTGAIGDIEQGALYLVTVGTSAAGTAAAGAALGFRLRYVDV